MEAKSENTMIPFIYNSHKVITNILVINDDDKKHLGITTESPVLNASIYKLKIYGLDEDNLTIMITHDTFRKHNETDSHYYCIIYAVYYGTISHKLGICEVEDKNTDITQLGPGFITFFPYFIDNKASIINLKPSIYGYLIQLHKDEKNKIIINSIYTATKEKYKEQASKNPKHKEFIENKSKDFKKFIAYIYKGTLTEELLNNYYKENTTKVNNITDSLYTVINNALLKKFPFISALDQFNSIKSDIFVTAEPSKKYTVTKNVYIEPIELQADEKDNDEDDNDENDNDTPNDDTQNDTNNDKPNDDTPNDDTPNDDTPNDDTPNDVNDDTNNDTPNDVNNEPEVVNNNSNTSSSNESNNDKNNEPVVDIPIEPVKNNSNTSSSNESNNDKNNKPDVDIPIDPVNNNSNTSSSNESNNDEVGEETKELSGNKQPIIFSKTTNKLKLRK